MIQELFKELDPYLKGLKVAENYNIVEVLLKKTWGYEDSLSTGIIFNHTKEHSNKNYYHGAFYSENKSFDEILEVVKLVVEKNLEEEEKQLLLTTKVEELKKMFQDTSLTDLKDLSFIYNKNFNTTTSNGTTKTLQPDEEYTK